MAPTSRRPGRVAGRLGNLHRQLGGSGPRRCLSTPNCQLALSTSTSAGSADLAAAPPALGTAAPFSTEQVEAYARDGAVLISGLVPPEILEAARAAMWQQMAGPRKPLAEDFTAAQDGDRSTPRQDDRSTWPRDVDWNGIMDGQAIAALFTPAWLEAATAVAEAAAAASPFPVAKHPIRCPDRTLALNKFPSGGAQDDPASWSPHFDSFVREGTSGWRTNPRPMVLQMICYLTGTGAAGEGGTVIWPGSHKLMDEL